MCLTTSARTWIAALITSSMLTMLLLAGPVLAQPYQRSAVLDEKIEFSFTSFEFSTTLASDLSVAHTVNETKNYKIHYASAGDVSKPGVIFIHGTPGDWGAFERYLESTDLQRSFFLISVDRMGWGASSLSKREVDGDFTLQAESIVAIMRQYPGKKWTIVGHSLGASLAPKIALMAPDSVDSLLLLAGSLNPKLGRPRWYNWAANTWLVASVIGKSMRYSNREIMALKTELTQMDAQVKRNNLDVSLVIMQGAKDRLVSPKNTAYAAREWRDSFSDIELIELADEGHFLPWRKTPLVIDTIFSIRTRRNQQASEE